MNGVNAGFIGLELVNGYLCTKILKSVRDFNILTFIYCWCDKSLLILRLSTTNNADSTEVEAVVKDHCNASVGILYTKALLYAMFLTP